MHALKESVSEKLSRLFSDSPSLDSDQSPKARQSIKEGKSWTSILTALLPPINLVRFRHDDAQADITTLRSDSFTWRSKSFSLKDKPLDRPTDYIHESEDNGGSTSPEEYCDPGTGRSTRSDLDIFEDATGPYNFGKSVPNLIDDSCFVSSELHEFFESCLPNVVKGCQWTLLYSTVKDGISLHTLIRKSINLSGPCLLISGDKQGAVFGGLLECPLTPTAKRKYQGTNQTFIFTTLFGEPRLFRPTGANRYFYLCLNDLLALGGGSNFALSLDEDLLTGTSGPSETFGNICLAHEREFELKNVELWGFTHASQFLPYHNGV